MKDWLTADEYKPVRILILFLCAVGVLVVVMQVGGEVFQKAVIAQCGDKHG